MSGVGWEEFATILLDSGERRHGLALEVNRDRAVVQVLEDTAGHGPDRHRRRLLGHTPADTGRRRMAGACVQRAR
ncbi:hypothetical protein [Streptomyces sp. NPDC020362]|uniref:hypothetical protein n=1 Tax=unclassified Streptomyces TaxID=2593676 RepID=UPI0033C66930